MQVELLVQALQDNGLTVVEQGHDSIVVILTPRSVPKQTIIRLVSAYGGRCTFDPYGPNVKVYIRGKAKPGIRPGKPSSAHRQPKR